MRRRFGLEIPETIEDACDPATMAVVVYDMQAGVVRQLPDGGAEAVERVSRVLTAARAGGYPVFFTRHMSLPARLMGAAQLRTAMAWQHVDDPEKVQSWFLRDTPGFQIARNCLPAAMRLSSTSSLCRPSPAPLWRWRCGISASGPSRSRASPWRSASGRPSGTPWTSD